MKSLLGLIKYYRCYIPYYSNIAYALTELIKHKNPETLNWTEEHDEFLDTLKKCLVEVSSLYTPVVGEPFVILSDASSVGIGAFYLKEKTVCCIL